MLSYLKKEDNLDELIKEGNVLVDFYADWCSPCQSLAIELENIAINDHKLKIVKVNVDDFEEIAMKNRIMTIPAIFLYKEGKLVKNHIGYANKEEILSWIK